MLGTCNSVLNEHLKSIRFIQTASDPCIYVKEENGDIFIVCIHVDDIILAGKTDDEIVKVKESIAESLAVSSSEFSSFVIGFT